MLPAHDCWRAMGFRGKHRPTRARKLGPRFTPYTTHPTQRLKAQRALNRHWAFSKKNPGLSQKVWSPTSTCREQATNKTTKVFAQQARGSRERFFVLRYYYYVNVTFSSTLRYRSGRNVFRLRYVTVAGVRRIAAHFEGPWPSLPSAV